MSLFKRILLASLLTSSTAVMADEFEEQRARMKMILDRASSAMERGEARPSVGTGKALTQEQMREAIEGASAAARNAQQPIQVPAQSAQPVPSAGTGAAELIERAYVRHREGEQIRNTAAGTAAAATKKTLQGIDPAEVAKLYNNPAMKAQMTGPKEELLVFISSSMPIETLRAIGAQAKQFGAVLVLRGVAGGFSGQNLQAMMQKLRPAMEQGADIQIHPELFRKYGITSVPATVLARTDGQGCGEEVCTQHKMIIGDVSVGYALEQFARGNDGLARIAEARLEEARNRRW